MRQCPLIQNQVVDVHSWLTMTQFADIMTIAEMTPGPIAINSATFVGIQTAGIPGAHHCNDWMCFAILHDRHDTCVHLLSFSRFEYGTGHFGHAAPCRCRNDRICLSFADDIVILRGKNTARGSCNDTMDSCSYFCGRLFYPSQMESEPDLCHAWFRSCRSYPVFTAVTAQRNNSNDLI